MRQTFYIDIEEEISSVVDRLNKSMSTDNYFVVPKRALFLQSIVNLKLLKREADKVGKNVFIVTQDEVGASMAQRSGIEVVASVDDTDSASNVAQEDEIEEDAPMIVDQFDQDKKMRLSGVGSSDFYDPSGGIKKEMKREATVARRTAAKRVAANSIASSPKKASSSSKKTVQYFDSAPAKQKKIQGAGPQSFAGLSYGKKLDPGKAQSLERMYAPATAKTVPKKSSVEPVHPREGRIKKAILLFLVACVFGFAAIAVYLFLPSAKIMITPNVSKDKIDQDLHAGVDAAVVNKSSIPLRTIDKEDSITLPYDVAGSSSTNGKKAHGTVVIYNEFDGSPQTLIATTRLESADGKIFRIVKNVVVPGKTTIGGEVKPGAVSADVVADQAGSENNIEPTSFTIPGFKDSPKFNKFYAKSTEAFIGGTSDGTTGGGAVTQRDIDNAKQKTEAALNEKLAQDVKDQLADGEISLAQAQKITITKSSAGVKLKDMVGSFNYTATATVHALVFSEKDVRSVILSSLKDSSSSQGSKKDISKIEYGTVNPDFDKNFLDLQIHSEITSVPAIDGEKIKNELLGKTDDQLASILRKYTTIKNVNVEFSPSFVTRIPQYPQRVEVEIKADGQ